MLGTIGNAFQRAKLMGNRFGPGSPSSLLTSSDEGSVSPDPGKENGIHEKIYDRKSVESSPYGFDDEWDRTESLTPNTKPEGPPHKTPGFPRMNPNTEKLLAEVFQAYCAYEGNDTSAAARGEKSLKQKEEPTMSLASWRRFCGECRLVEGELTENKLELLFYDIAYISGSGANASFRFEDFARALGQVFSLACFYSFYS
jgi:hypothetical protein